MNTRSQNFLKKSLLAAAILLTCGIVQAQSTGNSSDSTHRSMHHWGPRNGNDSTHKRDFHPGGPGAFHKDGRNGGDWQAYGGNRRGFGHGRGGYGEGRGGHGEGFAHRGRGNGIHYTPEQRKQVMAINKEYHDKSTDLFKKDNSTLREYKAGLVTLQKDKRSKVKALLTPQQKEQIASRKKRMDENRQVAEAARMERLKLHLNLSDDQVVKIKAGNADLRTQFKSIHENDNLLPQQKMEQMKGLMAKRKDVYKSVLTPEQFSKFEEMSHRHGFGHEGPGGRPGWDRGRHAMENDGSDGPKFTAI